ncbi:DNA-binding protein [Anaerotignum lactatifermentans]|uniref:DNA-binding protein n=1 Tax=Anaerotignum lactatifermentans TaxID=160404 RepID=UPI0030803971
MNDTSEKMVYDASDIQRILGIGRSMTYVFLEKVYEDQAPFKVIKIGKLYRVPKKIF